MDRLPTTPWPRWWISSKGFSSLVEKSWIEYVSLELIGPCEVLLVLKASTMEASSEAKLILNEALVDRFFGGGKTGPRGGQ